MESLYEQRGVSAQKDEVVAATRELDEGLFPSAFCKIFPDIAGDPKFCVIKHADGAGTKASLAYLAWKNGFGIDVFTGIAQDSVVMNIDDAACAGATDSHPFLITQIINRNKYLISGDVIETIITACHQFCEKMSGLGFRFTFTGGETADVGDLVRTLTVDNDIVVRLPRADVIDPSRIAVGDVIVGFSSTGQAAWEDGPNSGIGSNGITNARHDCLVHQYAERFPELYAPEMKSELVYCGEYYLSDPLPGDSRFSIASALMSPTRTYLPLIAALRQNIATEDLHALIHCSGGGQTKIGKFGDPDLTYVKDSLFPVPPVFVMLQKAQKLPWVEMYESYNMGHRLEAVIPAEVADKCIAISESYGIRAQQIGWVGTRGDPDPERVVIDSPLGLCTYD